MTSGGTPPGDQRRFPVFDEPERPPRAWRWWLVPGALIVIVAVVIAVVVSTGKSSPARVPTSTPSTAPQLPPGATPLPGATGDPAESFGTLGPISRARSDITSSQALRRYDRIAGVVSRRGSHQRVFSALVRAAFIDGGKLQRGAFWIVSVWYHPPSTFPSLEHRWCVDNGIVSATSGTAVGHVSGCLPTGGRPRPLQ